MAHGTWHMDMDTEPTEATEGGRDHPFMAATWHMDTEPTLGSTEEVVL